MADDFDKPALREALATIDAIIASAEGDDSPGARKQLMVAIMSKGTMLADLGEDVEAIGPYAEVAERFGEDHDAEIRIAVAMALLSKADCQGRLGRWEDLIVTHRQIDKRLEDDDSLKARVELVGALVRGIDHLARAGRIDEAAALAFCVADRFGDADETQFRSLALGALRMSATEQASAGRFEAALETFDRMLGQAAGEDAPEIQDHVAWTMVEKAKLLALNERGVEGVILLDEVVGRFGESDRLRQRQAVALAEELLRYRRIGDGS